MKLSVCLFVFTGVLLSCYTYGQNWDSYRAKFGDKPGIVMVDMELINNAPDKKYQYLVITGPRAQTCNRQGMPDDDEIDALEDILSTTSNFITGVTAKELAGTFTYNCERVNYYYVKDTTGIRNALMRMYDRGYKNYNYVIKMKYDPAWTSYRTFLYPDEDMLAWMEQSKIMAKMMESGDSLSTQRDIKFYFYFSSDTSRKSFESFASVHKYKAAEIIAGTTSNFPYGLVVSKYDYLKIEKLLSMLKELKTEAALHHGFFEHWDAVKGK